MGSCFSKKRYRYQGEIPIDKTVQNTDEIRFSQISIRDKYYDNHNHLYNNSLFNGKCKNGQEKSINNSNQILFGCQNALPKTISQYINNQPPCNLTQNCVQKANSIAETNITTMQVDYQKPFGIKNIPQKWQCQLRNSSLSEQQIKQNPKIMIEIISTFDQLFCQSVISKKILTAKQFEKIVQKVEFINQNPIKEFNFGNELGSGAACKVFKAISKDKMQQYAVRIIKINDQKSIKKIKSQIAVMHICSNPNIIEYHFTYYYQQSLFMFIELMDKGSLASLIKSVPLEQDLIAFILKQILSGLKIIHKKSQIHRDLKSDNILLNSQGQIKIADFGYALQLTRDTNQFKDIVGTPAWMAPQLIKKQSYNQKIDIWALGIVVMELCNGQPPYLRINPLKAMYMIVSQPPPNLVGRSQNLVSFTKACLKKNPNERLTAQELLHHPFITQIGSGNLQRQKLAKIISSLKCKNV